MVNAISQRSLFMLSNGCRESLNVISLLPGFYYRAICEIPQQIPAVLRSSPLMLVTAIPLGLYDREFGSMLVNNFVIGPARKFCWLISDPIHVLPLALKSLVFLTAVAIASLAIGIILGGVIGAVVAIPYGFVAGVIDGYSLPLNR